MNRYLIRVSAIAIAVALVFTAAAFGVRKVECIGNLCLADNGGISPTKLPRHGSAPIAARIAGEISTRDGTHPPAVRSVAIDIDKTIGIDAVGLPTCRLGQLEARTSADARRVCRSAIVGSGTAEVEVAFPEQKPFSSTGPVTAFNGGVRGRTTSVLLHAYVDVPAPSAVVTKATVTRIHNGRFGLRVVGQVPKIADGAGSITNFKLKVGRKFTYRGQRKSFLVASCPTGAWVTKGRLLFDDQTRLGLTHVFSCTPQG